MCEGNYDHDVIGVGNSSHPVNQEELPIEITLSPLEMENEELYNENNVLKTKLNAIKAMAQSMSEEIGWRKMILDLIEK